MNAIHVDAIYEAFIASLPAGLRATAADLPFLLRLAPARGIRFSEVFSHEVTLGAPFLIAEAFDGVDSEVVRCSGMAHALAVIEAFGTDRMADDQIEQTEQLLAVMACLRQRRDQALERVWPGAAADARDADLRSRAAIDEERGLLQRVAGVSFETYASISLGKQAVGFPAALALARAAGADQRKLQHVERALAGAWLGLQFEDDVVDWEDDWRSGGGAWAVSLARELRSQAPRGDRPTEPDLIKRVVLDTHVVRELLSRARRRYRAAWRHARALGAHRLALWAKSQDVRLEALVPLESQFAGYTIRMRKLNPWVQEVLT